jgi:hypothetical protein
MIRITRIALVGLIAAFLCQAAAAQESKAAQATRMKLKQKISVNFKEIRTADIFAEIKGEMEKPVNFKIDNGSGVSNNTKISYSAKDKTVEQILNELSDKGDFGWVVISNVANNKIDGWVTIRKSSKGKERGYEAGKEPKAGSSLTPLDSRRADATLIRPSARRVPTELSVTRD